MMNKLPEFNFFMDDHAIAPRDLYFDFKKQTLTFNIEITNSYLLNNTGRFHFSMKFNEGIFCEMKFNEKTSSCLVFSLYTLIFDGLPFAKSNDSENNDNDNSNELPTENKVKPFIIEPIRDFGISEDACQVKSVKTNQISMEISTISIAPVILEPDQYDDLPTTFPFIWEKKEKPINMHIQIYIVSEPKL